MEWWIAGMIALGGLWFVILAMMGAGKADNLKGGRLTLLGLCLVWPLTMLGLVALLVWKAIRSRSTRLAGIAAIVRL